MGSFGVRRRAPLLAWVLGTWMLAPAAIPAALADPHPAPSATKLAAIRVAVRGGEHPGFGRLVFDLPPGVDPELVALPDGVRVRVPGCLLATAGPPPRALRGLELAGDSATLSWAAGSVMRTLRLSGRLVVDVLRSPARPAHKAPRAEPTPAVAAGRRQTLPAPVPLPVAAPGIVVAAPPPSPVPAIAAAPAIAVTAAPLGPSPPSPPPPPPAPPPPAQASAPGEIVLPFAASTAAAAFRRGAWGIAVFDEARAIDPAALQGDARLAAALTQTLPTATTLRVKLPADRALALAHRAGGWAVAIVAAAPAPRAIRPVAVSGHLELPLDQPGRVVSMPDPDTGGLLLVGTQAGGPAGAGSVADGIAADRRAPAFSLPATWRGVVVEPASDDLVLRADAAGFVLERGAVGETLTLAAADGTGPMDAAARFSRRFDLPAEPLLALDRRLAAATEMEAAQPAGARGQARLRTAQAMLALGMGVEAASLVRLAVTDDARLAADPQARAIGAAASVLAGRPREAAAIGDPALSAPGQPGADEVALWRALLAAQDADAAERPDPAAAQGLAATLPLLQSYPAPLRDRLLPLALRAMTLGGAASAARRVVDAQSLDTRLDYVRALLDEREGHVPDALARLDRLAQGADRDIAARAAVRAVGLRLDSRALSPTQAADALDPLIYAWRGDGRELAVRLRDAALRMQAGQPRASLAMLRETVDPVLLQGWPDQRGALRARMAAAFTEAMARDAARPLPPLEFVAMVQENADLLPDGAEGQALGERVADRLAALDLPDQAATLLGRLMDRAPPGAARAALGGRLAALQMEQHDAGAALLTLSASTVDGLPPPLVESRTLLFARATAARGDLPAAIGALEALGTPAADAARAGLLAGAGAWPQAAAAWARVAERTLPERGALDDAQTNLLLRLASAAAQAGDVTVLAALRAHDLSRVPPGRSADLLRVLTEGPVQTVADLPRAGAEMALARSVLK